MDQFFDLEKPETYPNYRRTRLPIELRFSDLENPLLSLSKDPKNLVNNFKHLKIIPYSSHGDSFLNLIYSLSKLSSSKESCINSIAEFSFQGKVEVFKKQSALIKDLETQPLSGDLLLNYSNFIEASFERSMTLQKMCSLLQYDYLTTGNMNLLVTITNVNGKISYTVKPILQKYLRYENNGMLDTFVYCLDYSIRNIKNDKDKKTYKVYPNYDQTETTVQFIVHHQNGENIYGEPRSISCLEDQLIEYFERKYRLTKSRFSFMPDVIMEIEEDDPRAHQRTDNKQVDKSIPNLQTQINKEFANGYDTPEGRTMMVLARPFGAKEAMIKEIDVKTRENYLLASSKMNRDNIFSAHSWSQLLSGVPISSGWQSQPYMDELQVKETTIKFYQNEVENIFNETYSILSQIMNSGFDDLRTNFVHPFADILKQRKNKGNDTKDSLKQESNKETDVNK